MEPWQGVVLFLVGIVAGFLNVMAGGGSILTVPVMVFMGVPGPVANGTNRIAVLAQNITAVTTFFRQGFSDFKLSLSLALAAVPGAVAGAMLGVRLEGVWFNRVLAVIMIAVLLLMICGKDRPPDTGVQRPQRLLLAHVFMVLIGILGGFIQIGVGFVLMPALYYTLGLDLVRVNMHKTFIIGVYTIAALAVFATQVQILWLLGLCLAAGNSLGAWLSAHVQIASGENFIKLVLNCVLLLFIIKLLFFS